MVWGDGSDLLRDLAARGHLSEGQRTCSKTSSAPTEIFGLPGSIGAIRPAGVRYGVAQRLQQRAFGDLGASPNAQGSSQRREKLSSLRVIRAPRSTAREQMRRIQEFAKEKSEGEFARIRLNSLVRCRRSSRSRAARPCIDVETQVELGDAGTVLGNSTELREVPPNHPQRRRRHASRRTVSIRQQQPKPSPWFEVPFGVGMSEETQKIFRPLLHHQRRTWHWPRTVGLVSYRIIQRHQGGLSTPKGPGRTHPRVVPAPKTRCCR